MIPFPGGWRDEWLTSDGLKITIGREQEKILRREYPSLFKDSKDSSMNPQVFPPAGTPHPDQVQFPGWVSDGVSQWIQGVPAQVIPQVAVPMVDPMINNPMAQQQQPVPVFQQNPMMQQPVAQQPQQQYAAPQMTTTPVQIAPVEPEEEKDYDGILGNIQDAKGAIGLTDETINSMFKKGPVWAVLALGFFWGIFADSINFNTRITDLLGGGDDVPAVVVEKTTVPAVTETEPAVTETTPTTTPSTTITSEPPGEEPLLLTPPGGTESSMAVYDSSTLPETS